MSDTFAVVAGGGTGGHVIPALAIGRALVDRGHPQDSLHYVGSTRGIESRLVPEAGFALTLLPGRGIQRRLTFENVPAAAGLALAAGQAFSVLRRLRPRVVVTVGGYASVACGLAAATMRIPLVVHEQNAVPGAVNRLIGRYARACAVSYPGTPLPRAHVTGNPVRTEVLAVSRSSEGREEARRALDLPLDRQLLTVFGGSLGALRINQAVQAALPEWRSRSDLAVYHVVGARDWEMLHTSLSRAAERGPLWYRAVRYEDRMPLLYAAADLFVCRAGGNTVAELATVGVPAVLVPLPGAPGDHQTANARVLAGAGAAVLVRDGELDGERLRTEVDSLLALPNQLRTMADAAAALGRRDAAAAVAALVEAHARA